MNTHKENAAAYLEKLKKQAKNLFKLSKKNNFKVEINNLSEAQQYVAQIHGYPDWHAVNTTVKNIHQTDSYAIAENSTDSIIERVFMDKKNDFYVYENESHIMSFFSIYQFPISSYSEALIWIQDIKENLSLSWNMQFHSVDIILDFGFTNELPEQRYEFFKWSEILGISQDVFTEIFSVDIKPSEKHFGIHPLIAVKTVKKHANEHYYYCSQFDKNFQNKEYIDVQQLELLGLKENKETYGFDKELALDKLIFIQDNNHSVKEENLNWLNGIHMLYQKNIPVKLVAHLDTKKTQLHVLIKEDIDNCFDFFDALWDSLNKKIYNQLYNPQDIILINDSHKANYPWESGIPVLSKKDYNVEYIAGEHPYQHSSNNFIYAKPGNGKSILLNLLNYNKVASSNGKLPSIGIVDIGPASKGYIDFLKNTLSDEYKTQVIYHKLTNNDIINAFDTDLGLVKPTFMHSDFLVNFIMLLMSDSQSLHTETHNIIRTTIDLTYEMLSNKKNPRLYHFHPQIEDILQKQDFKTHMVQQFENVPSHKTSWWDVVDFLFNKKYIKEAKLAQTFAMPTIDDFINALSSQPITDMYNNVIGTNGMSILPVLKIKLTEASKSFPNLRMPTNFMFNDERIVVLDLDEVAKIGSNQFNRQTAVMYMLAMFTLTKNAQLYIKSALSEAYLFSKNYIDYMKESIDYDHASIVLDEYHRATWRDNKETWVNNKDTFINDSVRHQVISFLRNSRKFNFGYTIASQTMCHEDDMMYFANKFIYTNGISSSNNLKHIIKSLDLRNKDTIDELHHHRSYKMGDILIQSSTNQGTVEKILSLKINPYLLWIFSSTSEDVFIKNALTSQLGVLPSITLLGKKLPHGSKKLVMQTIEEGMSSKEALDSIVKNLLLEI